MKIRLLQLTDFRNYTHLSLKPSEGLNILYGENAQGKTNVLEAISLLATTRSLRGTRESEMIRCGAPLAHVQATVEREEEGEKDLLVTVLPNDRKVVHINGLKRERVLELLGQFNAVFFGATELAIVSGEPTYRRHFLNVEISQMSPRYIYDLGHYRKVLEQRNRLLRDIREMRVRRKDSGLDVWNEQLVCYGASLLRKRLFTVARLAPLATEIHEELSDGRELLQIRYLPGVNLDGQVRESTAEESYGRTAAEELEEEVAIPSRPARDAEEAQIREAFRRHLHQVAEEELRRGTTLIGPQRDDLLFLINGVDARVYGSQGQRRTVALALKLAEFRLIESFVGEPPVMLLDDVMSDLDEVRRQRLLHWVKGRCQTFLTCTDLRSFPEEILKGATLYRVLEGTVQEKPTFPFI